MATITLRCGNVDQGSGDVRATVDACHFDADELEVNADDGSPKLYRFTIEPDDPAVVGSGYSHLFSPSSDGKHTWDDFVFPEAGSWTVAVHDETLDSDAATLAVTVAEA